MKRHSKSLITILLVISLLMSNFAMIVSYAAIQDYPVELAFNNIFVFDKWASNSLSTTIVSNGKPVDDELDIDIENGSFRFTNPYAGEAYTGHGMGTGINAAGNYQYYVMEVEPNAAYTFSYNLTCSTNFFTPYVFFFNENNEYISLIAQPFSGSGDTGFVFVAPSNAHYIQIRFTLPDKGYADVKDIAIRRTEVASYGNNIFDFDAWASNEKSGKVCDIPDFDYAGGTVAKNTADKSVTLTTSANGSGIVFTNFTFDNGKNGYYTIDVDPNTPYNFSYNLASCNFAVGSYQPYVVFYRADGTYISYLNTESVGLGNNRFVFMTPADADFIQIVYGIAGITEAGKTCTVKDVAIQKLNLETDAIADLPHRLVYTYSRSNPLTYGELPVPSYAPDGYVFAGWYTGKNGTGTLITENTPVDYSSHTVYPKYDPIADSLAVEENPVKTEYTVGERVNPTGLVLEATVAGVTRTIDSGYYCTPEYLTTEGTQTVTAHYGGKTATFTVNVKRDISRSVVINGSNVNVSVTNNVYTITGTLNTGEFNRYEMTYNSDAYVEGVITYSDNTTEQFFLEPSSNFADNKGEFTSFIDGYLEKIINADSTTNRINTHTRNGIKSIRFTLLDNKSGSFDLLSVTTSKADVNTADTIKYFTNSKYKVGIDILNGGAVTYLEVLNSNIVARVYNENGKNITRVDYADKLPGGHIDESTSVNLINYYDNGRELQQSYYGTGEKPYEQGYYNRADWNYNPVQAGNVINEASKVIDYEITDEYIYIKARPLDWAKWSDDFANKNSSDAYNPIYGDEYITDTYVEAKYVFEDGMIKTYCRMVDYSGYPSAQTTQELPAFYTIEPLNCYVYNDVSEGDAWKTKNLKYDKEPEFWGIAQEYRDHHYKDGFSANVNCAEHWAAFTASDDAGSFGIGLYTPEVTNFFYGVYPQIYAEEIYGDGTFGQTDNLNYRHAQTLNPAVEDDSSYIAPIGVRTFESFKPSEYSYYISTGTVEQIRNSFGVVDDEEFAAELKRGKIVVPETIYMTPSTGESKTGQYYVNNILDKATNAVTPEADNDNTNAYVQFYVPGAKDVTIAVNTVTSGIGDIVLNEASNIQTGNLSLSYEGMPLGSVIDEDGFFSYPSAGLYINGTGLEAGQTAVAEWVFTITMDDGSVRTYYAYSTLYAPNYHSVGATAEARYNTSNRVDGAGWISGVHSVSTSIAPFGKSTGVDGQGAFKSEPLLNLSKPMTPQDWGAANNLTAASDGKVYAREYYRNSSAGSNEQSPVGILYVDYSRNKNTNTIPNVYVGGELLKADSGTNSSTHFYSYYTLGTGTEFQNPGDSATPGGWTQFMTLTSSGGSHTGTVASTLSSNTDLSNFVSVLRDANAGRSLRIYTAPNLTIKESGTQYIYAHSQIRKNGSYYANMYSAVQLITVNKADLRNLVLEGATLNAANYTTDSWSNYIEELRTAAANLGNPSANSVINTSALTAARNALQTVVTLNANNGSFTSGGSTTTFNATVGSNTTFNYDLSDYTPVREGCTLVGWSTDANATEGSNPVKAGLMPTLYAVWAENSYNVTYDANGGSGFIDGITVKCEESFALASYGFTKPGYTLLGWSTNASATTAAYNPGQTVSGLAGNNGDTVTLYAVWSENSYTVQFNANDGSGTVTSKTVKYTESFTLPSSEFSNNGSTLLGWATSAYATTADYQPGQTVSELTAENNATVTLYALWLRIGAVDDTIVIEYGLPVIIDVLTNDYSMGSVNAVGTQGVTDDDTGLKKHESGILSDAANNLSLANGNVTLNDDGTITYTPTSTNAAAEDVFFYEVKANDTSYYYAKVTVIPATTMYYEDTFFEFTDSEVIKNDTTYKYEWENLGEPVSGVFQNADRPGEFSFADDANNAYGYDSAFDGMVSYSGGAAHFVEVDQIAGSNTPTATFTFTGTGFDLFAVTDYNSGTITATIYRGTEINAANRVQGIISNTYFGYDYDSETDEYTPADKGAIFQIPVVRARDLSYGTYTVVVAPRYNKAFDVAGTGKCGVYVDSVRIFDPMGDDNDTANEAYMADGEFAPEYLEIRDTLVQPNADGSYNITNHGYNASVFIDGNKSSLEDFAKLGPKNEVYLGNGNSVAFHIVTVTPDLPATVQLGMRLTGINGSTADVKLLNGDSSEWIESVTLNSATERYYNIENVVEWAEQNDGTFKTASPVIIHNTSDAIISLTSLKWAYDSVNNTEEQLYVMSYEQTPAMAMLAINRAVETEIQQTILNKDSISFSFSEEAYTLGDSGVLTIATKQGVASVIVNGTDAIGNGTDENDRMIWIYEFTADAAGSVTFEIIASDENGFTSESVYASADVKDVAENTPETPDDGETDTTPDNSSCFMKFISFICNFIKKLINILRTISTFVIGGITA